MGIALRQAARGGLWLPLALVLLTEGCGPGCGGDCADECDPEGARACDGDGENGYEVCGEWDGDGCVEWGPVNPCDDYQTCDIGVCGPDCTDECDPLGATRCAAAPQNGVEVCSNYDADPCREWGGFTACGAGACAAGSCGGECIDECPAADERICDGDGYRVCGNQDADDCLEWSGVTGCDQGCDDGACVSCLPEDEPCEEYSECCDCLHCCPVLHVCVPDWWDSDCT